MKEVFKWLAKFYYGHFHVMKAWIKNLLTHIPTLNKDKLWGTLYILMHCPKEEHFNENLRKFYEDFQYIPSVRDYIEIGWIGEIMPWRRLWLRFGRLFAYGCIATINHIECHWKWIKYTLL